MEKNYKTKKSELKYNMLESLRYNVLVSINNYQDLGKMSQISLDHRWWFNEIQNEVRHYIYKEMLNNMGFLLSSFFTRGFYFPLFK